MFITKSDQGTTPIEIVVSSKLATWFDQQDQTTQNWIKSSGFQAKPAECCLLADANGRLSKVLLGLASEDDLMSFGVLPLRLNTGEYHLANDFNAEQLEQIAVAWGLGAYQFNQYKTSSRKEPSKLLLPKGVDQAQMESIVTAVGLVRDMINVPTMDMLPENISLIAKKLSKKFDAVFKETVGDDLLKFNYPAIYAVGKGSVHAPRLIDMHWGSKKHPLLTLVGKGVCFDTGGLDIKPAPGMRYMKKDMAGAAHVLGLARMIMAANLPVRLRVLIPAVENAISGNAYHPGDIITSRKGTTIEVTNTDAEGRLILADALYEAASENPDLLVDIATLTGAARVAVGTDISAIFTQSDELAEAIYQCGEQVKDPMWRLPMYEPYRKFLESPVADMVNAHLASGGLGGATLAALFLSEFVPADINWVHFDIMAWNNNTQPARPEGGEAMAIRGLFRYLTNRYR